MLGRFRAGVAQVVRPDDVATHQDLGIAFFEMDLFTQAEEEFQAALQADPERKAECLTMIARCRLGKGDATEAIELLEQVIVLPELAPDTRATAYLHLAEAHEASGKRPAALLHAKEARRIAPSLPGLARLQARLEGLERMLVPGPEFLRLEHTPTPA
jgi:tetratricopeptide (TPR) repeat protein